MCHYLYWKDLEYNDPRSNWTRKCKKEYLYDWSVPSVPFSLPYFNVTIYSNVTYTLKQGNRYPDFDIAFIESRRV